MIRSATSCTAWSDSLTRRSSILECTNPVAGSGRWGTSPPSLGVPVNFSDIDNIAALAEVSFETAA